MLTINIDGAGSAEVIEFCKVERQGVGTAILLARWSDQYVVWTVWPKVTEDMSAVLWQTGSGIYCANDLSLGRRTFQVKRDRAL